MIKKLLTGFRPFKLRSIQSRISIAFSCLILLSVIITTLIFYQLTSEAVERNLQKYTSGMIKQIDFNIQSYFTTMEKISLLALNKEVRNYFSSASLISKEDQGPFEKRISDLFNSILITRNDIESIMVFGYNGRMVSDRRITSLRENLVLEKQIWYTKAKEAHGLPVITTPHVKNIIQNEYSWVVSLSREIKEAESTIGEGVFLVNLNLDAINEICMNSNLGTKGYVFIIDSEGNFIYHPQQDLIYSHLKSEPMEQVLKVNNGSFIVNDGSKKMYTVHESSSGWKIVGVAYFDDLIVDKDRIQTSLLIWIILCLVVTLLCSYVISKRLTRPMKMLQENMIQVEGGDFGARAEIQNVYEVDQLAKTFNLMVNYIKELMYQIVKEQEMKRKSELKALTAQINPHFLYNTLDSIVWMAEQEKHEEVVLMTAALSNLFRASISKSEDLVPIYVELEHIKNYLTIQKMRYEDQLDFEIRVVPEIMSFRIPKIILQPLVENAIYHGIKNKQGRGTVQIIGELEEDHIIFRIIDNGVGISSEKLKNILEPNSAGLNAKGIGVFNVNERIKLYFGNEYALRFESIVEVKTEVTITIPTHEWEERR